MQSHSFDLTVIGSGPGGYVAAIRARQRGKRVALVERDRLGGVCLNWGCIPTKALLRIAERYEFLQEAADWGFDIGEVRVRWPRAIEKSRAAAERLSAGVRFLMKKHGIAVYPGAARFLSPHRIHVSGADGGSIEIQTTWTIIATGARPAELPGVALDGTRVISSKEAMLLPEVPRSLVVIGGGAIGVEFAYLYSVFGCEVTVVEYCPRLLPGVDEEVSRALERSFRKRGIHVSPESKVVGVEVDRDRVSARIERAGGEERIEAELALLAAGVRGNVEGLGLEDIGIETRHGFIAVGEHCETNVRGVYAIGDVIGPPALAHAASRQGLQAVSHLAGEGPLPLDRRSIPACIYCYPQVASVGLTEDEAIAAGHEVETGRFPFSANGKAVAAGETEGFVKVIGERSTGEILGAHIFGPEATELIGELTLARSAELTVRDVEAAIHAHPTLSESLMEAAADWSGDAVHAG